MIRNDAWITEMVREHGMIEPFEQEQVRKGNISYGLSSYGYDVRLAPEFKFVEPGPEGIVDAKAQNTNLVKEVTGNVLDLPPKSFVLGRTVEYLRIPRKVIALGTGKSTYARCGILVNLTPFEPEWEGFVTIGISNTSAHPVRLYANEGIAQILFFESDDAPDVSYNDRGGKYQAQQDITTSKI
jgi:dCTP deaminase